MNGESELVEHIFDVVTAYRTGGKAGGSLVIVIPESLLTEVGDLTGQKFLVKLDGAKRIIYEPIEK